MTACESLCPVHTALDVIGGKWKLLVLWHLQSGTKRYNELLKLIGDITPKMLVQQLRDLEADGIVERTLHPVIPPRVDYALTTYGKTLDPMIAALEEWGKKHRKRA